MMKIANEKLQELSGTNNMHYKLISTGLEQLGKNFTEMNKVCEDLLNELKSNPPQDIDECIEQIIKWRAATKIKESEFRDNIEEVISKFFSARAATIIKLLK